MNTGNYILRSQSHKLFSDKKKVELFASFLMLSVKFTNSGLVQSLFKEIVTFEEMYEELICVFVNKKIHFSLKKWA